VSGFTGAEPDAGDIDSLLVAARFVRAYPPATAESDDPHVFAFLGSDLVTGADFSLPASSVFGSGTSADSLFIGALDGRACVALRLPPEAELPAGLQATGLRGVYGRIDDELYAVAGYAIQLLNWRATYQFCSRCGTRAERLAGGWSMQCPACGLNAYPPVSPAVLALVHDGADRVLLASKEGWGTRFSILAGFVEPGESLEGCVAREAYEEAGIQVSDCVYCGSQPWPYPHQVMIGFTARYRGGAIVLDETELSAAAWFRYDDLPDLPPPLSLSRQIIDAWASARQAANR
jgi:NAD+ diphosphatase